MNVDRQSHAFVLRIWWEEGNGAPVWRGWVQHAVTGNVCYFRCISELLAFVEQHTGVLEEKGHSRRLKAAIGSMKRVLRM